jgi:DNA repair protein RadC
MALHKLLQEGAPAPIMEASVVGMHLFMRNPENMNEEVELQEQFMAVYLNYQQQVVGYRILSTGNMTSCHVDVRLLVSLALHCMATKGK